MISCLQGVDISADLRRMCPSLTMQQLYRLTEYHHDDWLTSGQNSNTILLLERIKQIVDRMGVVSPYSATLSAAYSRVISVSTFNTNMLVNYPYLCPAKTKVAKGSNGFPIENC